MTRALAIASARAVALSVGLIVMAVAPAAGAATVPDPAAYPAPRVVLSQDATGAVLWWDATPWIERMVNDGVPRAGALAELELEAVKLFVSRAPVLPTHASHLRVVVVFARGGMMAGAYRTSVTDSVRTLLSAEGAVRAQMTFAPNWEADAKRGVFPRGVTVTPAADLPSLPYGNDGSQ
ncbi:MAG TPA: hypothetical protein VHT05_07355 [Candidatus Elarobacter sp.]|nr:hypothetical protein [Candidatus Elarobacter sp.]